MTVVQFLCLLALACIVAACVAAWADRRPDEQRSIDRFADFLAALGDPTVSNIDH